MTGRAQAMLLWLAAVLPIQASVAASQTAQQPNQSGDIVVHGAADNPSPWLRAESDHFVVLSHEGAESLERTTDSLERLFHLLSRLYRQDAGADRATKLTVILVDSGKRLAALELRDLRSQQGPFEAGFRNDRYHYDPREDGAMLVVARSDAVIDLATNRRDALDCQHYLEETAEAVMCSGHSFRHPPVVVPWQSALYSGIAQHFLLTYQPAAYPRWYLDGVGALFAASEIKRGGKIDYATAPPGYQQVFLSYGYPDVAAILTGAYLDGSARDANWSPYGAWLLAHYFLYSNPPPARQEQFRRYMADVRNGMPLATAAKAFGDMKLLQREIEAYAQGPISGARTDLSEQIGDAPLITTLGPASSALVEQAAALDTHLAAASQGSDGRKSLWLDRIVSDADRAPYTPAAHAFAAEAACRSGDYDTCMAVARTLLDHMPKSSAALTWEGVAQAHLAARGPAATRDGQLASARAAIARAIGEDDDSPAALIAYFRSFAIAGETPPEAAMRAIAEAIRRVPAAPAPRLDLARELVREGKASLAARVLFPVLHGAYDSPERQEAASLLPAETRAGSPTP